ncbi:MAG: ATP-binding protein, partial [Dehalococcoidia bacterium]
SPSAMKILEHSAQHTPLGLVVFDHSGVCGWTNDAAGPALGLEDPSVLVGRLSWWEHCSVPGSDSKSLLEQAFHGSVSDLSDLCYDLQSCTNGYANQSSVRVSATVFPLVDEYGRVAALYVFNQPIRADNPAQTEWEEQLLQHSIAMARRMSVRTAHDFNNIIAVVQGYSSILQTRLQNDPENRQLAEFIETAGAEALDLTNWFSGFGNKRVPEPVQLDLNQIVSRFLSQHQGSLPAEIDLHVSLSEGTAPVTAEEARLEQVCLHLWENAIDAMPNGGSVHWETSLLHVPQDAAQGSSDGTANQYFRLRVKDTGSGMEEATRSLVFEPFFTTKAGRFRGLGLTMVYDAVRAFQGWVQVFSTPGEGTCVEVHLSVPAGARVGADAGSTQDVSSRTRRLLVVDDESMIRVMLQEMLKSMGYEVLSVGSGEEAVELYLQSHAEIDAVILDLKLTGMSGVETFERLRQLNNQAKIILSSGDPHHQSVRDLVAQGVAFLCSPAAGWITG